MKNKVISKPSKASLTARGLASKTKPPTGKRGVKSKEKPAKDSKPGYSLYTSDSEDQASSIDRGLNRCAALLSNILDNEDKGSKMQPKVSSSVKAGKLSVAKGAASQPPKLLKTELHKAKAFTRKVVIPSANADERGSPSPTKPQGEQKQLHSIPTAYNDRLVSSTPVLTGEDRQRHHQLQRREAELQQELSDLKQRYELLQRQNPEHQRQQQLLLQNSMMKELENHQEMEREGKYVDRSYTSEVSTVLRTGEQLILNSAQRKPTARRSLDYSGLPIKDSSTTNRRVDLNESETSTREENDALGNKLSHEREYKERAKTDSLHTNDNSETQSDITQGPRKQVRIVSPTQRNVSPVASESQVTRNFSRENYQTPSSSAPVDTVRGSGRGQRVSVSSLSTPPSVTCLRPSSAPVRSKEGSSPASAENQVRMVQYLIDELRALLGNTDDLEVDRLLNEIDDAVKLLPYMLQNDKTTHVAEQTIQSLRVENAQLRRKLQIARENPRNGTFTHSGESNSAATDLAFELAACRSVNTVLQKQLTEEKNSKEELLRSRDHLSQSLSELQEEKRKFVQILANKEQNYERRLREWQQETSKISAENKTLKADLEAVQFSTEAERKEINILNISLKQKDAEIDRLKELTRGLQHSLTRLLADIQQFHPSSARRKNGLLDSSVSFPGLDELLGSGFKTKIQTTRHSPDVFQPVIASKGNLLAVGPYKTASSVQCVSGHSERHAWNWLRKSPTVPSRKILRFVDTALETEEPKVKNGKNGGTLGDETSDEQQNGGDLSSLSSTEEEEFRRDLANLDADIARIQKSLRETAARRT